MTKTWPVLAVLGLALTGMGPALPAADTAPAGTPDPEVLRLREAVWRDWFAGDEAALRRALPAEFVGLGMGDAPFASQGSTIEESRAYRAGGGRLVSIEFPETRQQRYGDVIVFYGRYSLVLEKGGTTQTIAGRLTEVFLKKDGRWTHPGWHLDQVATRP
jgi:uncharacterized protein DUF4440